MKKTAVASYLTFQGIQYNNSRDMMRAVAHEWLSAGGVNSVSTQKEMLADKTDTELAEDAAEAWPRLSYGGRLVFGDGQYNELVQAFADLRTLAQVFTTPQTGGNSSEQEQPIFSGRHLQQ